MYLAIAQQFYVPDKLDRREKRMTFEPRRRSCWVLRLRASRVLRNPRPKALRSSRPVEGASNKAATAPMAIPASNHGTALPASDCQYRSSECAWFVMSGSCRLRAFLKGLAGTSLIGAARRLNFGPTGSNFLLPLDFLPRTAVGDALFLIGTGGIFTAHLTGFSSTNGGTIPSARTVALLVCPQTRLAATRVLCFWLFLAFNIDEVIDDGLLAFRLVRRASG
jgi:hypothetical protein